MGKVIIYIFIEDGFTIGTKILIFPQITLSRKKYLIITHPMKIKYCYPFCRLKPFALLTQINREESKGSNPTLC